MLFELRVRIDVAVIPIDVATVARKKTKSKTFHFKNCHLRSVFKFPYTSSMITDEKLNITLTCKLKLQTYTSCLRVKF